MTAIIWRHNQWRQEYASIHQKMKNDHEIDAPTINDLDSEDWCQRHVTPLCQSTLFLAFFITFTEIMGISEYGRPIKPIL